MFEIVQNDLKELEGELLSVIHSQEDLITDISRHLVKAGGKRLRPALYLVCARSKCSDLKAIMPMALAIELIHMATLVHDDVIDEASTRRGRPTANACWGNYQSVLTGDFLFAKAFSVVAMHVDQRMLKVLTDVMCSMCEGEIIQDKDTFNPDQSEGQYLVRIAKKTADFIAASCELGGMVAGLPADDIEALRKYGYSIGMAFQITDDILDVTASSEQIGKPAGHDLRQGIVTLPVIFALENSKHKNELREIIVNRAMTEEAVKKGLKIIHDTTAVEYSYQRVADYLHEARNILPPSIPPNLKQCLLEVADFVGLRKY
ncbi:Heptaprenyl diphosphate synthase component 2 [bioreactor metagenome]|uniref:Heptaprenyl diphosphate synthase component 2 n=1 Tax=bioreactor metagenome TaxID=1076179 RepID=A0A644T919_9ZZZZ|nr:polyprenyl synthetase family protein [Negativicutes bacterium]